jgi:hypothetical protein
MEIIRKPAPYTTATRSAAARAVTSSPVTNRDSLTKGRLLSGAEESYQNTGKQFELLTIIAPLLIQRKTGEAAV